MTFCSVAFNGKPQDQLQPSPKEDRNDSCPLKFLTQSEPRQQHSMQLTQEHVRERWRTACWPRVRERVTRCEACRKGQRRGNSRWNSSSISYNDWLFGNPCRAILRECGIKCGLSFAYLCPVPCYSEDASLARGFESGRPVLPSAVEEKASSPSTHHVSDMSDTKASTTRDQMRILNKVR